MAEILLSPGTLTGFAFVFGKREKNVAARFERFSRFSKANLLAPIRFI
jgi:hypothetical protein